MTAEAFDLDTAHALAGDGSPTHTVTTLAGLVERSLIIADSDDATYHYRVLEPIRRYARRRLEESGTLIDVQRRHAEHVLETVEGAAPHLRGPRQLEWLDRLESRRCRHPQPLCRSPSTAVTPTWRCNWPSPPIGSGTSEGTGLNGRSGWGKPSAFLERGSRRGGHTPSRCSPSPKGPSPGSRRCLDIAEQAFAEAEGREDRPALTAAGLALGIALGWRGDDLDRAAAAFASARRAAVADGDEFAAAWVTKFEGLLAVRCGDLERAVDLQRAGLSTFEQLGDEFSAGHSLIFLGRTAMYLDEPDRAGSALGRRPPV